MPGANPDGIHEVPQRPAGDYEVVAHNHQNHAHDQPAEPRAVFAAEPAEQTHRAPVHETSAARFKNEQRQPDGEDAHEVGHDERSAAVLPHDVGKAPQATQPNSTSNGG